MMEAALMQNGSASRGPVYSDLRTDSYVVLAALLREPPSGPVIGMLQNLRGGPWIPGELDHALQALQKACLLRAPAALADEFKRLFAGAAGGEVMPYASWYRERQNLSAHLRSDLLHLGIMRREGSHDPEDHAGVLCEIMSTLTQQPHRYPRRVQSGFFREHLAPWLGRFFEDLISAPSSEFYRTVALFGYNFVECESEYLNCDPAGGGGCGRRS